MTPLTVIAKKCWQGSGSLPTAGLRPGRLCRGFIGFAPSSIVPSTITRQTLASEKEASGSGRYSKEQSEAHFKGHTGFSILIENNVRFFEHSRPSV